ncbi:MAG: tRNA(Ile)-lysidine synthetase-like protein [Myxococcota bacterium]|jgi:tRNA(Ile)-lysidine synthetase-like protein
MMEPTAIQTLLEGVRSRGEIKRLGARIDQDPTLWDAVVRLADAQGVEVESDWSGKRLVRALLGRSGDAQVRKNPIRIDESFACVWCSEAVPHGGARVRDHCPRCLRSLHVDVVPGDRAADCGGVLHPTTMTLSGGEVVIQYRCGQCQATHQVRAHPTDKLPPSLSPADLPGRPAAVNPRARTLPRRVLDFIRRGRLWSPGERVAVAVSGGVDSTCLLEILARTEGAHGGRLEVVSFDHGLRPESKDEVEKVAAHAARLGLPFVSRRLSIPLGPNLQARARMIRRAELLARGADRIATGHHRTDRAETVLYHLLRGSGARGLRGMLPLDPPWCRPLLSEPRTILEDWARQEGLSWVEDPSNPDSQRGVIRELMPRLDAIHGGAEAALARSGRLLARDDAFLNRLTDTAWERLSRGRGLDLAGLRAEDEAIQLRLLVRLTAPCPRPVRADQLEAFLDWRPVEGGGIPLPAGNRLVLRDGLLILEGA